MTLQYAKRKDTKCSKCGSALTYMRISTKERVCRTCGYIAVDNAAMIAQNALDAKTKEVIEE